MFSTKCRSNYNPNPYLTIDEHLGDVILLRCLYQENME